MKDIKFYTISIILGLTIVVSCTNKGNTKERLPFGITASVDSIILIQYKVNSLDDTLCESNLVQTHHMYFDEFDNIISEKTIGIVKGKVDYITKVEFKRNGKHKIIEKKETVQDAFIQRESIETRLSSNQCKEIWVTNYFMSSELVSNDTSRILYSENSKCKEVRRNGAWERHSESIYENSNLTVDKKYSGDKLVGYTEHTYDPDGRIRTIQDFIYDIEGDSYIAQPNYTYTYIYDEKENPVQQVIVFGGVLQSISKIDVFYNNKSNE